MYKHAYNQEIITATLSGDIPTLTHYYEKGVDLNRITNAYGDTLIHIAIDSQNTNTLSTLLNWGLDVNQQNPNDGLSPLNLAACYGYTSYLDPLIGHGADFNTVDESNFTALMNAIWFENYQTANHLLTYEGVDVNIPAWGEITPLELAYLDNQWGTFNQIMAHPTFNPTYEFLMLQGTPLLEEISAKMISAGFDYDATVIEAFEVMRLFGLRYDLQGDFTLMALGKDGIFSFSFEGYFNHLGMVGFYHAYEDYQSNVINVTLLPDWAQGMFAQVHEALALSASTVDPQVLFDAYLSHKPILVQSGWEGHSIVFVIHEDRLYRCNRGHLSESNHGIEEYIIHKPDNLELDLIELMLDASGDPDFLQVDLIKTLGLEKVGVVETVMQTAGNCVWTSLEAGLEALMITSLLEMGMDSQSAHILAKQNYLLWENYDMTLSINELLEHSDFLIENNLYDDFLLMALEAHHQADNPYDVDRGQIILDALEDSDYWGSFEEQIGDTVYQYDHNIGNQSDYMQDYNSNMGNAEWLLNALGYYGWQLSSEDAQKAKEYHDFLIAIEAHETTEAPYALALHDIFSAPLLSNASLLTNMPHLMAPSFEHPMEHMEQQLLYA